MSDFLGEAEARREAARAAAASAAMAAADTARARRATYERLAPSLRSWIVDACGELARVRVAPSYVMVERRWLTMKVLGHGWKTESFVLTNDGRLLWEFPYCGTVVSRDRGERGFMQGGLSRSEGWTLKPHVSPEAVGAQILEFKATSWVAKPSIWFASCEETGPARTHLDVQGRDQIISCQHSTFPDGESKDDP